MSLIKEHLKEIICARLSRSIIYLRRYSEDLPNYLLPIRHKFEHPLSELHILLQQLSSTPQFKPIPTYLPPKNGIPEDINYFDLALNEIKTALIYYQQRESSESFQDLQDYYLEQKLTQIINQLEEIEKTIAQFIV
jgi:hypothetical protein